MRTALILGSLVLLPVAAQAGFRVSSHKEVGKSTEFDAASAIDDNGATAWQIDPESEQVKYFEVKAGPTQACPCSAQYFKLVPAEGEISW